MAVFIHHDGLDLGRRHGIDDELGRVFVPQHDIDPLAGQLVGNRLDPGAPHADAGPDRIDARLVAPDGDLGAQARIPGRRHDVDQTFADFRHLDLEQLDQEPRFGTAHEQLRTPNLGIDFLQETPNPVTGAHRFTRDHVFPRNDGIGIVAQIQIHVAALDALDHAHHQFTNPVLVGLDHLGPFRLAHLLHDDLLGGLGGDAAKVDGLDLFLDEVTDLDVRVVQARRRQGGLPLRMLHFVVFHHFPAPEGFIVTGFAIDVDANVHIVVVALLGRGREGNLDRLEDHVLVHALLVGNCVDHQQNLFVHRTTSVISCLRSKSGKARVRLAYQLAFVVGYQIRLFDIVQRNLPFLVTVRCLDPDCFVFHPQQGGGQFALAMQRHAQP